MLGFATHFYLFFKITTVGHLGYLICCNFIGWRDSKVRDVSPCQISSKSWIHCGDIAIFRFSRCRPSAILDLFGAHLDYPRRVLDGLYHCTKFGYDRCSIISIIWTFQYLAYLARKGLSTPKNWGFWSIWPTKLAAISTKAKNTVAWVCVIWAIKRENLTCWWVP